jgi:type IV pilus assembly protein PilF
MKRYFYYILGLALTVSLVGCSSPKASAPQAAPTSVVNPQQASKINVELGLRYLAQGQRARAKEKLLLAQSEYETAQTNAALAYFYEQVAEPATAEKFYQKAISLNPEAGAPHNNYGAFLCRQKRYQDADGEFNKAIQDPKYLNTAGAYENAGICALMIPDTQKATEYFTKALQQNPNMLTSLEEMARLSYNAGQYQGAKNYVDRYLAVAKQPSTEVLALGVQSAEKLSDQAAIAKYKSLLPSNNSQSTSQE